jgi:hypothetical protein
MCLWYFYVVFAYSLQICCTPINVYDICTVMGSKPDVTLFCIGMFIYRSQVVLLFAVEPVRGVCMHDHLSH